MKKVKCAHVFGPVPKTTQGSSVSPFSGIGGGKQKYRPVPQNDRKRAHIFQSKCYLGATST